MALSEGQRGTPNSGHHFSELSLKNKTWGVHLCTRVQTTWVILVMTGQPWEVGDLFWGLLLGPPHLLHSSPHQKLTISQPPQLLG